MTRNTLTLLTLCVLVAGTGCHAIDFYTPAMQRAVPPGSEPPRELSMVSLPPYRIGPPDVLFLNAISLVPLPSYRIAPQDALQISTDGTLPKYPIRGQFVVDGDGNVNLGPPYGVVHVAGRTSEEAEAEILRNLRFFLKEPKVSVQLSRSDASVQLTTNYTVGPDGVVNLGCYGMVYVTDTTVLEARKAIERQLAQYFDSPQVSVEIRRYRSKSYYVITDTVLNSGDESMWRFPITGNETVLDALCLVQANTTRHLSMNAIWVARPTPGDSNGEQILPVDLNAITQGGVTATNYQIMPGDRIYIIPDSLVAADTAISRVSDPMKHVLGLLYTTGDTVKGTQTLGREYNKRRFR
jgi:polysaccharide biosynthesis/export protein